MGVESENAPEVTYSNYKTSRERLNPLRLFPHLNTGTRPSTVLQNREDEQLALQSPALSEHLINAVTVLHMPVLLGIWMNL